MRNRLSRILWAFLAAALCAFPLTAETKAKAVDPETKGNELYLQKNYSGAIQAWSGLIRQGQGSGKMYARLFDLGVRNLLGFDMTPELFIYFSYLATEKSGSAQQLQPQREAIQKFLLGAMNSSANDPDNAKDASAFTDWYLQALDQAAKAASRDQTVFMKEMLLACVAPDAVSFPLEGKGGVRGYYLINNLSTLLNNRPKQLPAVRDKILADFELRPAAPAAFSLICLREGALPANLPDKAITRLWPEMASIMGSNLDRRMTKDIIKAFMQRWVAIGPAAAIPLNLANVASVADSIGWQSLLDQYFDQRMIALNAESDSAREKILVERAWNKVVKDEFETEDEFKGRVAAAAETDRAKIVKVGESLKASINETTLLKRNYESRLACVQFPDISWPIKVSIGTYDAEKEDFPLAFSCSGFLDWLRANNTPTQCVEDPTLAFGTSRLALAKDKAKAFRDDKVVESWKLRGTWKWFYDEGRYRIVALAWENAGDMSAIKMPETLWFGAGYDYPVIRRRDNGLGTDQKAYVSLRGGLAGAKAYELAFEDHQATIRPELGEDIRAAIASKTAQLNLWLNKNMSDEPTVIGLNYRFTEKGALVGEYGSKDKSFMDVNPPLLISVTSGSSFDWFNLEDGKKGSFFAQYN